MKEKRQISKKILCMAVCLMLMVVSLPMTAFAKDSSQTGYLKVGGRAVYLSSEPAGTTNVEAAYLAYQNLVSAMEENDLDALKTAYDELTELTDCFTDEEYTEWEALIEEVGFESFFVNVISGAMIITASDYYDAYVENPNVKTAYEFVSLYEEMQEAEIPLNGMISDIDDVYNAALSDMPSQDVLTVYEAYSWVQTELAFGWLEDLEAAVEAFYDVTDIYNELDEADFEELAVLLDVEDGEAAAEMILSDWIDANVVVAVGEVYTAYIENPNEETAEAFIEMIDSYDEMYGGDRTVLEIFFMDLEEVYTDAESLLLGEEETSSSSNEEETSSSSNEEETTKAEENTTSAAAESKADGNVSPETGDGSNAWLWFVLAFACAGVACGVMVKEREKRTVK